MIALNAYFYYDAPDREYNEEGLLDQAIRSSLDLGKCVRKARIRANLSQAQVAAFSGVGKRFIYDLEKGKPTIQIAKALQVLNGIGMAVIVKPKEFGRG